MARPCELFELSSGLVLSTYPSVVSAAKILNVSAKDISNAFRMVGYFSPFGDDNLRLRFSREIVNARGIEFLN